jgi:hypothetical protein
MILQDTHFTKDFPSNKRRINILEDLVTPWSRFTEDSVEPSRNRSGRHWYNQGRRVAERAVAVQEPE